MKKILIVDDSTLSRRILQHYLEDERFEVFQAEDGETALDQYKEHRPDVVLLDMTMRGMHGLEVLARLREVDPEARIIVSTADIQQSTREMAIEAGATSFVYKPLQREDVVQAVLTVLEEC